MVVLNVKVKNENRPLYMDDQLHHQLTSNVQEAVQKQDFDWLICIDGEEGSGKSVFGMQVAKVLDPNFTEEQIAFDANEFIKLVVRAKKHSCVVFDEAFTGLSSRSSLSEINQLLVSLMMEMRQRNLFVILIMPTFFMLDKYCVLHRAKGLFHVHMNQNKRGFWNFYNRHRMKMLYLTGKKYYEYTQTKPIIFGRFQNQYMVDEEIYRERKASALHKKKRSTRAEVYKQQRDDLLYGIYKDLCNKNRSMITRLCQSWKVDLKKSVIYEIVKQKGSGLQEQLTQLRGKIEDSESEEDFQQDEQQNTPLKT